MTLSAAEVYLLELINRGRLDPAAEAARFGIGLNAGLPAGTISIAAKQVLAPNAALEKAAVSHSKWMISVDKFSHTGQNGSQPSDRAEAAGYTGYSLVGENIAWAGTTGSISINASTINTHYRGLFLSEGHRANTMTEQFREVGLAEELGAFRTGGTTYNSAMLTEVFGLRGASVFLTGVAYTDKNSNNFYDIGEGRGGVTFTAQGKSAAVAGTGLYALRLSTDATQDITGRVGSKAFSVQLDMSSKNAKLDVVGANTFFTSTDITLKTGIHNARLLGVADLDATGNASANTITGNKGDNALSGMGGNDRLSGGLGDDTLTGGAGNDVLGGAAGADVFVFANAFGSDQISDFSISGGDILRLDDAIWGGAAKTAAQMISQYATDTGANIVLNFGTGEVLTLIGVSSTAGLAGVIEIF
jgi:Ca2+-binding RTX toxin-like protein